MLNKKQRLLLTEYYNRFGQPKDSVVPNVLEGLFPVQLDMITDPSKMKVAYTSRRAGKTYGVTRAMIQTCLDYPGSDVGYLTKTRDWAESLVWQPLKDLNEQYELGIEFNSVKLKAVFPNGSMIRLAGAKDRSQAEVLRGFGYKLFVIDEAGSIEPSIMEYVLKEVLAAAMGEYEGTLLVVGTPNPSCQGYFHDISTNPDKGFSIHHWTQRENPEFPRWAGLENWQDEIEPYLEEEREKWGFELTDPEYLREYCGQWVRSDDDFIYVLNDDINTIRPDEIPYNNGLKYVLGIDMGFQDESAYTILGYDQDTQMCYHIEDFHDNHMGLQALMDTSDRLIGQYVPEAVVIDPASGGMHLVQELQQRYDIPCLASDKKNKAAYYRLLRADFRKGLIKLQKDSELWKQCKALRWNKDFKREAEGIECDLADAWLYSYRYAYHYIHVPKEPELTEEEKMWAEDEERFRNQRSSADWY